MMDRAGGARLTAKSAIHAFGDINIELGDDDLTGLRVLLNRHRDAIDRACSITGQATCADFQIDIKDTAIAERQRILHPHRDTIGILDRIGLADHMRGSDRHSVKYSSQSLFDVLEVYCCAHCCYENLNCWMEI